MFRNLLEYKRFYIYFFSVFLILSVLTCCVSTNQPTLNSSNIPEKELTLGIVQKEIKVGMSQAEVISVLGSPNIVTRDSEGRETWVYDKIATEYFYTKESKGIGTGAGAGGISGTTLVLGLIGGGYEKEKGKKIVTQKTLTIIIKFDKNSKVESFSYHATKF